MVLLAHGNSSPQGFELETVVLVLDFSLVPFVLGSDVPVLPDANTGGLVRAAIPEYNDKTIVSRRIRETANLPNVAFKLLFPSQMHLSFRLVVFQT